MEFLPDDPRNKPPTPDFNNQAMLNVWSVFVSFVLDVIYKDKDKLSDCMWWPGNGILLGLNLHITKGCELYCVRIQ